jgi:hypothetical protein
MFVSKEAALEDKGAEVILTNGEGMYDAMPA